MKIIKTSKWKDKIKGGIADNKNPNDFNKNQLDKGVDIEMEHTDDPEIAKEIAMDHLEESKDFNKKDTGAKYYDKLEDMEVKVEDDLERKSFKEIFNIYKY